MCFEHLSQTGATLRFRGSSFQIRCSSTTNSRIVLEKSYSNVARLAENATHFSCLVTMIDLRFFKIIFTNRAASFLTCQDGIMFFRFKTIKPSSISIRVFEGALITDRGRSRSRKVDSSLQEIAIETLPHVLFPKNLQKIVTKWVLKNLSLVSIT